jgi:choline dehydrogenase
LVDKHQNRAYVRGAPEDYDSWANIVSDERWSYKNVLPVLKRMEDRQFDEPRQTETKYHGSGGPVTVTIRKPVHAAAVDFLNGAEKAGAQIGDYNGEVQNNRAAYLQQTIKNGERWSAADAYIWNNLHRPNLEVVCNALVHRVLFRAGKSQRPQAYAVEYSLQDGATRVVECKREIIISCSSVGSPAVLLRSGIGPKEDLAKHRIQTVVDNPEVGKSLEDHPFLAVVVQCRKGKETQLQSVNKANAENMPGALPALTEWATKGTGIMASSAYDATYFFKTGVSPELNFPDGQVGLFVSPANSDLYQKNLRWKDREHIPAETQADNGEGLIFVNTLLHPHSKGAIELRSVNPKESPKIVANYFLDERDLEALAKICARSMEIKEKMETAGDVCIPADLKHLPLHSVELWKEMSRRYASTLYHPTSSCKMGLVVNSDLTVKGVQGLRVADASVMPHVTSGNTNCPSMLIGEMCADFIAQDHRLSLGGPQPIPHQPSLPTLLLIGGIGAYSMMKLRSKM